MSYMVALASDRPLETLENPHMKMLSVNEALEMGVEVPKSMLADFEIDRDEPGMIIWSDVEPRVDIEKGIFDIPDPEDNFDIWPIDREDGPRTEKEFLAAVEWSRCTIVRARMLLDYIRRHMETAEELELWNIWEGGSAACPPIVKTVEARLEGLEAEDICRHCDTGIFQTRFDDVDIGKQYRLLIKKD